MLRALPSQRSHLVCASGRLYFSECHVPSAKREPEEKPVCSRSSHCEGCPYPSHGFVCWHDEERCLRTEMEKIHQRDRKNAAKKQIHN